MDYWDKIEIIPFWNENDDTKGDWPNTQSPVLPSIMVLSLLESCLKNESQLRIQWPSLYVDIKQICTRFIYYIQLYQMLCLFLCICYLQWNTEMGTGVTSVSLEKWPPSNWCHAHLRILVTWFFFTFYHVPSFSLVLLL